MKLHVVWISPKSRSKEPAYDVLTNEYATRIRKYVALETTDLPNEPALLKLIERSAGRTAPVLVLLDSRGKQMTSEEFAGFLDTLQASAAQQVVLAIGPADGFSDNVRRTTRHVLSLGKMTLPHELARVVLLEQMYRAFTIMNRHPYHFGH
jgi:23S rRNA (pseudouridine1915-N3)-methyltransferase